MENVALIEWLNTFSFEESVSLENGIIFEKLIALLEGSSLVKENWSTYAWDLPFYKKRLANVYFKFGCGSSLENTLKLIEEYHADRNECDTLVCMLLGALVYGPRKKEFALNIGSLPIETQEQLLELIDENHLFFFSDSKTYMSYANPVTQHERLFSIIETNLIQRESLENDIHSLLNEKARKDEETIELKQLLLQYEAQLNEKNTKVISLQMACEREREKLRNEIANNQIVSSLRIDCNNHQVTNDELRLDLLRSKDQNEDNLLKLENLTKELECKGIAMEEKSKEQELEREKWIEETNTLSNTHAEEVQKLEEIINQLKNEAITAKQTQEDILLEVMKSKSDNEDLGNSIQMVQTERDEMKVLISQLKEEMEDSKKSIHNIETERDDARKLILQLKDENEQSKKNTEKTIIERDNANVLISQLKKETEELSKNAKNTERERNDARILVSQLKEENDELKKNVSNTEIERDDAKVLVSQLKEALTAAGENSQAISCSSNEMMSQLSLKNIELIEAKNEITSSQLKLETVKQQKAAIEAEKNNLASQLEEKKHLSNELLDSHQTEIQILSEQNKKIESDYQNSISQIETLKEKLSEKETQLEENNSYLKQTQKEEGEEQDLMKKIREIKEESERKFREKEIESKKQLHELISANVQGTAQFHSTINDLSAKLEHSNATLKLQKSQYEKLLTESKSEIERLKTETHSSIDRDEAKKVEQEYEKKLSTANELRQEYEEKLASLMDNQDKGNNKELDNKAKMLDTQSLVLTQTFYRMAVKLMQQKQEREDSKENLTQDATETINKIKERSNPPQTLTSLTYSSDGNHFKKPTITSVVPTGRPTITTRPSLKEKALSNRTLK